MGQWYKNTVPECNEKTCSGEMLVTVYSGSRKKVVRAVYIPYHHCTLEEMGWDMCVVPDTWEYVKKQDSWWIPEGWYEIADYFGDYTHALIEDKVVAWSKLPKPYEPRLKQLN